jgi:hypothetical protein
MNSPEISGVINQSGLGVHLLSSILELHACGAFAQFGSYGKGKATAVPKGLHTFKQAVRRIRVVREPDRDLRVISTIHEIRRARSKSLNSHSTVHLNVYGLPDATENECAHIESSVVCQTVKSSFFKDFSIATKNRRPYPLAKH